MRVDIPDDRPVVEVILADGTIAVLSPLAPDDRHYLVEGWSEVSTASRFARFGQGRFNLSESEWNYLTRIDQRSHVAWVAAIDGLGAGVGRYIVEGEHASAEVAVTVVDEHQGKGIGTALFLALVAVARADGVKEMAFEVVPSNSRVLEIMSKGGAEVVETGGLIEGRVRLEGIPVPQETEILAAMERFRETIR